MLEKQTAMMIREATHDDVAAIARVHVDSWRSTYQGIIPDEYLAKQSYEKREVSWNQILNGVPNNSNFTYVAENESGEVIGFANGGLERTKNPNFQGELNAIYILEKYQRQGIGRKLLGVVAHRLIESDVNSMLVWVLAKNPACQFYEALGGAKVKEQKIERGGATLIEVAYGWTDTVKLRNN